MRKVQNNGVVVELSSAERAKIIAERNARTSKPKPPRILPIEVLQEILVREGGPAIKAAIAAALKNIPAD